MQIKSMITLGLGLAMAGFDGVGAAPAADAGDISAATRAFNDLAARKNGGLCDISRGNDDCRGASGDKVNTDCACLYLIPGNFPHPGHFVYVCQPHGQRQC